MAEEKKPETVNASPISKAKWELRSARPGHATLYSTGSSDLKNVEVGDVLSGIGRIQSIQIEGGLWVVRGTKGNVSQ